jgi:hypothetical protein
MADLAAALERLTAVASPAVSYNTDLIRQAWDTQTRKRKETARAANAGQLSYDDRVATDPIAYSYVDQLWTDHIIVRLSDDCRVGSYLRVPYTVNPPAAGSDDVVFGTPEKVREVFVAASARSRGQSLDRVLLAASD